jgi:hypothetical protein
MKLEMTSLLETGNANTSITVLWKINYQKNVQQI